jgi:hypothetical protein
MPELPVQFEDHAIRRVYDEPTETWWFWRSTNDVLTCSRSGRATGMGLGLLRRRPPAVASARSMPKPWLHDVARTACNVGFAEGSSCLVPAIVKCPETPFL